MQKKEAKKEGEGEGEGSVEAHLWRLRPAGFDAVRGGCSALEEAHRRFCVRRAGLGRVRKGAQSLTRRKEESSASAVPPRVSSGAKSKAEEESRARKEGLKLALRVQSAMRPSLSDREKGRRAVGDGWSAGGDPMTRENSGRAVLRAAAPIHGRRARLGRIWQKRSRSMRGSGATLMPGWPAKWRLQDRCPARH
ncbi:uncharacterized protein M6B38_343125 [Iris pallida]|uniref:Uncharacterized protein n=1 Tax=Iris pallida TaxID=29817 RepID=A0AAX6GV52_IRIPA|nr:uncharacterized protein M6B38_343125 [Iris pallida]